ncbi:hypothetical protein [Pelagibaculum spongiae]|uniref:DUF1302 domain-containing protein n=1 Tax=Pelagibaculum spongiae TaxID=2080658 RepID=A0A2V1GTW5_9GAMM|nr:hypothetical protein [Pelagibaculum spongiae]PVZ69526.1 hypothetical protein DC094_09355 [Pelagibaculum spongiae]
MKLKFWLATAILTSCSLASQQLLAAFPVIGGKGAWEASAAFETRIFPRSGYAGQGNFQPSIVFQPSWIYDNEDGDFSFIFSGYSRFDLSETFAPYIDEAPKNSISQHYIKDMYGLWLTEDWEYSAGFQEVFWGTAESLNLVDIINQQSLIEGFTETSKLGQPMLKATTSRDWGDLDLILMPGAVRQRYPKQGGRLSPIVVSPNAEYADGDGDHNIDLAIRWARTFGDMDLGLHYFSGVSRSPSLEARLDQLVIQPIPFQIDYQLVPVYHTIDQVGLDLNWLLGDWVFKLEMIEVHGEVYAVKNSGLDGYFRELLAILNVQASIEDQLAAGGALTQEFLNSIAPKAPGRYRAAVAGLELDLGSILSSDYDWRLILETFYDQRSDQALPAKLFTFGGRWAMNDENSHEAELGMLFEPESESGALRFEFSRRVFDDWLFSSKVQAVFLGGGYKNVLRDELDISRDHYIQLSLETYF